MNRFPYRDVEGGGLYYGGGCYDNEEEYRKKKLNAEIGNLIHLTELGCDEIVKRLTKKYKK